MFADQGLDRQTDNPAALSLKGRLLKDRARRAGGIERARLYAEASAAYDAADALSPAPYRAINAATARFLAGEAEAAMAAARSVLARLDTAQPPADTPFFLAATRAEARLLLGDTTGAAAAMTDAIAADPDGWDDRATTLAQLGEIVAAQGGSAAWLDAFRPPASLHFAGHMALAAGGSGAARLRDATDDLLARHRIGFGWGALAAGSDIIIAEQLVAAGAELHVVLPSPCETFAIQSVIPAGADWSRRYRQLLDRAASVRIAGQPAAPIHDPLATERAGHLAIGAARLNARRLGAGCVQWLVEDEAGGGPNTVRQAALWADGAGPQERIRLPRELAIEALFPLETPDPARRLVTLMAVLLDLPTAGPSSELASRIDPVARAIGAAIPATAVQASPGRWVLVLDDRNQAIDLARKLTGLTPAPPAIGLHQAIEPVLPDPVTGTAIAYGNGTALALRLAAMAPAGSALCSDALAVSLAVSGGRETELYHFGEDGTDGPVHLLGQ